MARNWQDVRAEAVERGLISPHRFHVAWSEEDSQFVATCDAYPSLSWLDDEQLDALAGIMTLVRVAEDDGTRHDLDDVLSDLGI